MSIEVDRRIIRLIKLEGVTAKVTDNGFVRLKVVVVCVLVLLLTYMGIVFRRDEKVLLSGGVKTKDYMTLCMLVGPYFRTPRTLASCLKEETRVALIALLCTLEEVVTVKDFAAYWADFVKVREADEDKQSRLRGEKAC